jgi:hypothetical protein
MSTNKPLKTKIVLEIHLEEPMNIGAASNLAKEMVAKLIEFDSEADNSFISHINILDVSYTRV